MALVKLAQSDTYHTSKGQRSDWDCPFCSPSELSSNRAAARHTNCSGIFGSSSARYLKSFLELSLASLADRMRFKLLNTWQKREAQARPKSATLRTFELSFNSTEFS